MNPRLQRLLFKKKPKPTTLLTSVKAHLIFFLGGTYYTVIKAVNQIFSYDDHNDEGPDFAIEGR